MHLIAVVDEKWGIGRDNGLLFRLPLDMQRFRTHTEGGVVIMGSNTLRSLPGGKPLAGRVNFVLSRSLPEAPERIPPGVWVCSSPAALYDGLMAPAQAGKEVYIIGGAAVYALLLPFAEDAFLTHVEADGRADRFFPNLLETPGWECAEREPRMRYEDPKTGAALTYAFTYYRNAAVRPLEDLKEL